MPTFTLPEKDLDLLRRYLGAWRAQLEQDADSPLLKALESILAALVPAADGTFDPAVALTVMERVATSGPGKPVVYFQEDSDGPEICDHAVRLSRLGMFTLPIRGKAMIGTNSGLAGEDAQVLLSVLRKWNFAGAPPWRTEPNRG